MKIALYIEDGLEQIVLTPESDTERAHLGRADGLQSLVRMTALFAPYVPRRCSCGAADVTRSDHAERIDGALVVHGLLHCFLIERKDR